MYIEGYDLRGLTPSSDLLPIYTPRRGHVPAEEAFVVVTYRRLAPPTALYRWYGPDIPVRVQS